MHEIVQTTKWLKGLSLPNWIFFFNSCYEDSNKIYQLIIIWCCLLTFQIHDISCHYFLFVLNTFKWYFKLPYLDFYQYFHNLLPENYVFSLHINSILTMYNFSYNISFFHVGKAKCNVKKITVFLEGCVSV